MSEDRISVEANQSGCIAEVLLDQNLEKPLDYSIPAQFLGQIRAGLRVEVPLKSQVKRGTVAMIKDRSDCAVRPILRLLDEQASLPESLWKLAFWMARYYSAPLQRVLKQLTPPSIRKDIRPKTAMCASLSVSRADAAAICAGLRTKSQAQAKALEALLSAGKPLLVADLLANLNISRSAVAALAKKGTIRLEETMPDDFLQDADFFPTKPKVLTSEQAECFEKISNSLQQERFAAHLIYGVTGSGKTEIYLQAIQKTLSLGKSAILLVPEIALTSQTIECFRARFGLKLAIFHHRRSLGERTAAWEALRKGDIQIAIGARSAVFSPAKNLGLMIIDEEHDHSYKQTEETPTYHARDVAVMRAKMENAVVVLGSATPSMESYYNAQTGKYQLSVLKQRATRASLPGMQVVDMRIAFQRAGGFTHFSQELLDKIQERCKKGEQTLLLLNRRGFHRMQLCAGCQHIAKCPHCDLSLTFHREENELRCHLCNYQMPILKECPVCRSHASLEFRGFGTEHVERSLHAIFPDIRTLRMDRDTTRCKTSHDDLFKQFRANKADVLIGTQMIAKGFHFPSVTLVGILNADASLQIPDFRSTETLFQLLIQTAGRAGRAELSGEVVLQTFLPDHPLFSLAVQQNYATFYEKEIEERRLFSFPPFCRLVKMVFIGDNESQTRDAAANFYQALLERSSPSTQFYPPLPSGHPKVKDRYRFQFLIKTQHIQLIADQISALRQTVFLPKKVFLLVDIDPTSTFF